MKHHLSIIVLTLLFILILSPAQTAYAAAFIVDTTSDTLDANLGDGLCADSNGDCSLRAAIGEANALAGADTITLPGGTYLLTRAGAKENANLTGDLDITEDLVINGYGPDYTIVDANDLDRAFHVLGGVTVELNNLTITNGTTPSGTGFLSMAGESGGGVLNLGNLSLSNSTIRENVTGNGGHGVNGGCVPLPIGPMCSCTTGQKGGAGGAGAGIYNTGTLTITVSTISNNRTGDGGDGGHDGDCIVNTSTSWHK